MDQDVMTEADFARHLGVSRQHVNRLKADGRLVLDAQGRVRVAESKRLIAQTAEGKREGVADRLAAEALAGGDDGEMTRERIRKLLVLLAGDADEFELALRRGEYVTVEAAAAALFGLGVDVRAALDNTLATLPARLAVCGSREEIAGLVAQAIDEVTARLPRMAAQRLAQAGVEV